ncbi:Uncharacterized protein dnm_024300 [Desulfonema magnum]|uniref:Uncharacterized protein n=1 Tax=Desulfonema magnum TaxID=45655 RepID=A0A975BJE9_9BACT|nr:Uncharacterized protein dnm_024300 [Desulfonema magnum]
MPKSSKAFLSKTKRISGLFPDSAPAILWHFFPDHLSGLLNLCFHVARTLIKRLQNWQD